MLEKASLLFILRDLLCAADGNVADEQKALIIFAQNTAEVTLKDTKDRIMKPKAITLGTYLANIVAHGKTSRVVFTIPDPKKLEAKAFDISKIVDFLKGKKK